MIRLLHIYSHECQNRRDHRQHCEQHPRTYCYVVKVMERQLLGKMRAQRASLWKQRYGLRAFRNVWSCYAEAMKPKQRMIENILGGLRIRNVLDQSGHAGAALEDGNQLTLLSNCTKLPWDNSGSTKG